MNTTPLNELQAVNIILSAAGEQPVSSLSDQLPNSAVDAQNILAETSQEVQIEGWHFNVEINYDLQPGADGAITLPPNLLRFDLNRVWHPSEDYAQRGNRLYDRVNHTYNIGKTINCKLILFLPFDELPAAAKAYIAIRAARKYVNRYIGSTEQNTFNAEYEYKARARLIDSEADTAGYNMLQTSQLQYR